jgi:hypothetical protein
MQKEDLIGASVLMDLTIVSPAGEERREAYIGHIKSIEVDLERFEGLEDRRPAELMTVDCHDGQAREFPYDGEALDVMNPGSYELPDGTTIDDPDYFISWRMIEPAKH